MRELHMRHHFQDDTRGFGVSAPFWDHGSGPRSAAPPHADSSAPPARRIGVCG